ncbi:MAG: DUF1345 domain-containing protein [Novosphingobium sp.]
MKSLGNRIAPPRFLAFLILLPLGLLGWGRIVPQASWQECLALGFDFAAALFLLSLVPLLRECPVKAMRRHAADNDANRVLVLVLSTLVGLAVMAAITGELAPAKSGEPYAMAKLIGTIALIWLFANAVYTLHYAHAFYQAAPGTGKDSGGIDFPGTKTPDYADFAYFAFTLGMTFQTSDVSVSAPGIRRIMLFHCLAAFVFNIGVIAFVINALG